MKYVYLIIEGLVLEFVCLPWSEVCSARVTSLLIINNRGASKPDVDK